MQGRQDMTIYYLRGFSVKVCIWDISSLGIRTVFGAFGTKENVLYVMVYLIDFQTEEIQIEYFLLRLKTYVIDNFHDLNSAAIVYTCIHIK